MPLYWWVFKHPVKLSGAAFFATQVFVQDFRIFRIASIRVAAIELTRGKGDVKVLESIQQNLGELDFGYSALDDVFSSINEKERLRQGEWMLPGSSILVVQMFFHAVAEIGSFLTSDLQTDFESYGFTEIRLADYTTVEPYGGVELFGLKPRKWWGYHEREDFLGKPYG